MKKNIIEIIKNSIYIFNCLMFILLGSILVPYEEILVCEGNECKIETKYIILQTRNSLKEFNRQDKISVLPRGWTRGNYIYNYTIHDNLFYNIWWKHTAQKIIDTIYSSKNHIKVSKYWFLTKFE